MACGLGCGAGDAGGGDAGEAERHDLPMSKGRGQVQGKGQGWGAGSRSGAGVLESDVVTADLSAGRRAPLAAALALPRVFDGAQVFHRRHDDVLRPVTRERLAPLLRRVDGAMYKRFRETVGKHLWGALSMEGLPQGREASTPRGLREARRWIQGFYQTVDQDVARWMQRLRERAQQEPRVPPASLHVEPVEDPGQLWVERYHRLQQAAVALPAERLRHEARLVLGERLLGLMVGEARQAEYRALIRGPAGIPLMAAGCESVWQGLSGTGWRLWRDGALAALRRRSEAGHEVVYLAGGTDVYTLLRHGVRRIRVIDPIFPVQRPFYCRGWRLLLRGRFRDGGIGDRIVIRPIRARPPSRPSRPAAPGRGAGMEEGNGNGNGNGNGRNKKGKGKGKAARTRRAEAAIEPPAVVGEPLVLTRVAYRETGTLEAGTMNDGSRCRLPSSVTRWRVDGGGRDEPGYLVFERRFMTQADLRAHPERALLISFNELYYVLSPRDDNWGIDPRRFPAGLTIHVKQLRRPLDRAALLRLRGVLASKRYRCVMGTEVR